MMSRQALPYTIILTAVFAMIGYSRVYGTSDNNFNLNQSRTTYAVSDQQVYAFSSHQYRTTLDIDANQLNQSHQLTVTGRGLSGAIRLDGRVLATLETNGTSINLAPYLSRGRHNITISGPAQGNVQMTFTGPGINLIHQANGSSWMDINLTLEVW